ncbi:hypothetical protein [Sphingobium sp. R-21]|uniref:hypothetical protein n=1 Tax=Sphingobium sp. R-21 TaxID=3404056 RepID=UPI003CF1B13E
MQPSAGTGSSLAEMHNCSQFFWYAVRTHVGETARKLAPDAVSIFQQKAIGLFADDRIRWTDNDRER